MFLVLFCLLPGKVLAVVPADGEKKTVLYINSYHNGYQWSDAILAGIRHELGSSRFKIDLQIEYMDAKKYHVQPVIESLLVLYKKKFSHEQFDVVLVSDDDAFNFALQYRDILFPEVPIVFCGVNDLSSDDLRGGNLTGVMETFDLHGTLDIALKLHPEKNRMIVVGDTSTAGLAIRHQIEELVPSYRDRLQVDYWTQLSLEEVQRRAQRLPDEAFLFFIPYYQVIGNQFFTAEEVMASIYAHSRVPLYTAWEFLLGHGAVGGRLLSGFAHGKQAAMKAVAILDGQSADRIPVNMEADGVYLFDYQVMKRLQIDEGLLPDGSRLINAPSAFYELPRELFWTIIVSFLLLLVAVMFLAVSMVARRKVERKMLEQLRFQETLIDTIPQLVSWKDSRGRYVGANRSFATFFGLQELGEVVGRSTAEVVEDRDYVTWSVGADSMVVSERGDVRKVRRKIVDSTGQESWLEVNKVPLRDQDGGISGILTTADNVTREWNLEKQLLQSQKMEAIGTLAGGIAHDFNNILTSIINSIELAIGDVEADTQTERDLQRALKAARRGGRVVKQILAFSQPTQEGFQATDCSAVMTEVMQLMEVSLPSNIVMRSHIAPAIKPIHANPTQIHQALMNLCTNAFHALREKGGEMQLRLEEVTLGREEAGYLELTPGPYIRFTVADSGPGIDHGIIDKIFDPFFSTKEKPEGTGLGLSVVHGIVKGHNGGVRVRSETGQGTIFEIFVPRVSPDESQLQPLPESRKSAGGSIIFIEDDEDQLHTVPRLLEAEGYEVEGAGDSEEAMGMIGAEPGRFDLLITDYDMPGCNGLELVERARKMAPGLPVIMVSGREDAVAAAAGVEAVARVLVKPYEKEELVAAVRSVLEEPRR